MNCPTKLIYDAATKTPTVEAPRKTVTYKPAEEGSLSGQCWLCGCETETGHPKKRIIKPTLRSKKIPGTHGLAYDVPRSAGRDYQRLEI